MIDGRPGKLFEAPCAPYRATGAAGTMQPMRVSPASLVLLSIVAGCSAPGSAASSGAVLAEQVQRDVDLCVRAVYRGDVDTVLRFTHPMILEKLGGLDRVRADMEPIARQAVARKMSVESLTFPRSPDILQAGARRFAIVPTLIVIRAGDERMESLNYQLGVLEPDASGWKYVEGSRINSENVRDLFPDFPAGYQFPTIYRKKL